jgi:putative membrane protein insertion efficiency factor
MKPAISSNPDPAAPRPSVPARCAMALIWVYQCFLSPFKAVFFGGACGCRFQPTCSCYAREAFKRHGFFRGLGLGLWRILRCHPWHPGGYDPVPDLKSSPSRDIPASCSKHPDG